MQLSSAAEQLNLPWSGEDVTFRGCSNDSRRLTPGALFIALSGEHGHGHQFMEHARRQGATAALVEEPGDYGLPYMVAEDSLHAFGSLARLWRERFRLQMIAVTGSNGKTTVKEMLAAILSRKGRVLATQGNYNNEIGVPLTLCELAPEHEYAVVEMGANHQGEITYLASLACPDVGVVTQCAPAHLEGFGSVENVARTKGELFAELPQNGTAVINRDDPYAPLWSEIAGTRNSVGFGLETEADVGCKWHPDGNGSRIELNTPAGHLSLRLPLPGRHNVMNALAATAASLAIGIELEEIGSGLEGMTPVKGRLRPLKTPGGAMILDDSYNANPGSLAAGLAVLCEQPGSHWLALGEMAELGEEAADYHRQAGTLARKAGIERLYAIGPLTREAVDAFGSGAHHYSSRDKLAAALLHELKEGVTLLVKGSRSAGLDRLVDALAGGIH